MAEPTNDLPAQTVSNRKGLSIIQPTSTTIQYTVSTRNASSGPIPRILTHAAHLLRLFSGLLLILVLWMKWHDDPTEPQHMHHARLFHPLASSPLTRLHTIPWTYILPAALLLTYILLRRLYAEESLLVLHSLGLQTSTTSPFYLLPPSRRFIPTTSIQDVFIHEAFRGFEVRFYLCVVVEGEEDVVVVFPRSLPRRDVLEVVWKGARRCLWGRGGGGEHAPREHSKEKGKEKVRL